jgi:hypothetical protein
MLYMVGAKISAPAISAILAGVGVSQKDGGSPVEIFWFSPIAIRPLKFAIGEIVGLISSWGAYPQSLTNFLSFFNGARNSFARAWSAPMACGHFLLCFFGVLIPLESRNASFGIFSLLDTAAGKTRSIYPARTSTIFSKLKNGLPFLTSGTPLETRLNSLQIILNRNTGQLSPTLHRTFFGLRHIQSISCQSDYITKG